MTMENLDQFRIFAIAREKQKKLKAAMLLTVLIINVTNILWTLMMTVCATRRVTVFKYVCKWREIRKVVIIII